jgi:branched-chain amino acid transport system substrate-binding protein
VTRITGLSKKPDLIFFCSYAPGGPSAIRQLRAAGVTAAIATGESLDGDYWIGSVPDLNNFYVVSFGSKYGDDPDANVNGFFKRFEAKYGKKADVSYGLRSYSAVQAWAEAANKAGSLAGRRSLPCSILSTRRRSSSDRPPIPASSTSRPRDRWQS